MSSNPATSVDPGRPPINIDGGKISVGVAILANALQLVAVLFQTSSETKTFLFLLALLVGGGLMLWVTHRWPKGTAPIAVFVAGTLAAIALLFWMTGSGAAMPWHSGEKIVQPTIYYMRVLAFANDPHDGEMQTDHPLTGIQVMTRDMYGHTATYKTSVNGTQTIPIESVPPETFAMVIIGACGVFQTHHIAHDSSSPATAQTVQIGIDLAKLGACSE